ncbi:MAG: ATP-binding protein [Halothece sp.]
MEDQSYNIVPSHLAVQAMRDNGYKNAAYALAELMDNAIQAGASQVELLCGERKQQVEQRKRSRIEQVAVLDNGSGMDADVLRLALQFGNGTYLEEEKHTGIGRFGMGLPSSSISQCQRVDVWSWQNGMENALYTYLDLEEIKSKKITEVPEPQYKSIPSIWENIGNSFGESGTLVVWSQIDRCIWKTGKTIIENSELLIGRMYRKFLNNHQVSIRMVSFDLDYPNNSLLEREALPNDPTYLMAKTSCPKPFDKQPMFQPWEEEGQHELTWTIDFEDKRHEVTVRFSYAKEEARQAPHGKNPGDLDHGKHAAKNVGISVVRAGRELDLDQSLVRKYDPTERWWGIEVEFPPSLDNLFGVTNNKQSARNFAEIVTIDIESLLEGGKTIAQLKEELRDNEDPRAPLIDIAQKIQKTLSSLRSLINNQRKGTRRQNKRHEDEYKPEKVASAITKERKENGYCGQSDKDESLPQEQRQSVLEETFKDYGMAVNQARELAAITINDNLKYVFHRGDLDSPAFFSVIQKGGAIIITLNTNHPAYSKLVEVLEDDVEEADIEKLRQRLKNAHQGLELLLMAWARHEDEQPEGKRQQQARDNRVDWGRIARSFLENEED